MNKAELTALIAAILLAGKYETVPADAIEDAEKLIDMARTRKPKEGPAR